MQLAFRHDIGRDLRYLIARVTGAPVHVALLFTDEPAFTDVCIEAETGGVRQLSTTQRLARTIVEVPTSPINTAAAHRFATRCVGEEYDWWGVALAWWLGRPGGRGVRDRWFCSELAAGALLVAGIDLQPKRAAAWTPRKLFDCCKPWTKYDLRDGVRQP